MVVLVGCEESQTVMNEFRKRGHNAYSCDLQPCSGGMPEYHLQMDVHKAIDLLKPDLGIFHPPCTRLTNAVWWYIVKHSLYDEVKEAAQFFNSLLNANIPMIAIENPVMNKEAKKYIRPKDQLIQPYRFGDNAKKATCLWLKNLPVLKNTIYFPPRIINGKKRWGNQTAGGQNKLGPSKDRSKLRSKTYPGIAMAMADQWSRLYIQTKLF